MSIKVMTRVWEDADVKGPQLLCLLALADWCDDSGSCRPSYAVLAKKMRVSRRTAMTTVAQLEEGGHLSRRFRKDPEQGNRSNVLTLTRYAVSAGVEDVRDQAPVAAHPSDADDTTPGDVYDTPPGDADDTPLGDVHDTTPGDVGFTQIRQVDTSKENTTTRTADAAPGSPTFTSIVLEAIEDTTMIRARRHNSDKHLAWAGAMLRILGKASEEDPERAKAILARWWRTRDKFTVKSERGWAADLSLWLTQNEGRIPDVKVIDGKAVFWSRANQADGDVVWKL